MVNISGKREYHDSLSEIEDINNINDSYKGVCSIWTHWLMDNDLGVSLYSFKKYYWHLMGEHYAASTINMNLVMMRNRMIFLFDKVNNEIDKRATFEYKMKQFKPPSMPVKNVSTEMIFSKKEINRLVAMSGKRSSIIIEFLYLTACRRSEMCNIMVKDCEKKRHHVEISVYGKRNKIRTVIIGLDIFKRIQNVFQGKKYLFQNLSGNQYTGHSVWAVVSEGAKKYLGRHMSPHMIRHTRLTHLYEETKDMKGVSLFAGHSSIKTSLDYYVHHGFDKSIILGSITDG